VDHPLASRLRDAVERAARALEALDDAAASRAPAAGKWSPKEVLGHLIDSALVNYQRFAQAAARGAAEFGTYDQQAFVALQCPREAPWSELVALWRLQNRHLARLVARLPAEALAQPLLERGLERVAWKLPAPGRAATLEYFVGDYLGHLTHHLGQIAPGLGRNAD